VNVSKGSSNTSVRQLRLGELLRRNLAESLRRTRLDTSVLTMLSISSVAVTSDLKIAKVYLSILTDDRDSCAYILQQVAEKSSDLRRILAKAMTVKSIPELRFYCQKLDLLNIVDKESKVD
jgi:ribosome-binding factor A